MANPLLPTTGLLELTLIDLAFLQTQVTLPFNLPLIPTDATGVRDSQGVTNNVINPLYGAADSPFTRLTFNAFTTNTRNNGLAWNDSFTNPGNLTPFTFNWGVAGTSLNYSKHLGGFVTNLTTNVTTYNAANLVDYSVRNPLTGPVNIFDANPRLISNIINNQDDLDLATVQDDPTTTPNGRLNPLSGPVNPLVYSGYFTIMGQFFDHGLDFVHKGTDGFVYTPILPGDPLYVAPTVGNPNPQNYFKTARTNTTNGESINTVSPFVDLSQEYGSVSSHTVFLKEWKQIVPGNVVTTGYILAHQNTVQTVTTSYQLVGGVPTLVPIPATNVTTALDGGQATWADIKINAKVLGLTLHDYNVNDIPLLRQNADGSLFQDANGFADFVATNKTTLATVYVKDTSIAALNLANLTLSTTGHAFLDDQAAFALAGSPGSPALTAAGDNPVGYNATMQAFFTANNLGTFNGIDQHYISGDGRTNENIGLTSIHEVFHNEHERNVDIIKNLGHFVDNGNGTWTATNNAGGTNIWTGEQLFQAARILTEGEYQHMIFAELARKFSPNIDAFTTYNVKLNANISSEFANSVYRLGHSMLTENIQRGVTDPITGKVTQVNDTLFNDFLNPSAFKTGPNGTAAEIAMGMSLQTGNEIDEWVTDTLRNHLVKNKEDLATRNLVRGRDSGTPSLNDTRASLYQQTNRATLAPYQSWNEFGLNMLHSQNLQEFIMAYAHDDILTKSTYQAAIQTAVGAAIVLPTTLAGWGAFQLANPDVAAVVGANGFNNIAAVDGLYTKALKAAATAAAADSAFMNGGNQDFWNIDLWVGGLAEKKVDSGLLGSTMDAVFAAQMSHLQNGDRLYYINRFNIAANILPSIDTQLLSDIVMRNTGAKHLYSDIFSVPDNVLEMSDNAKTLSNTYVSESALINAVNGSINTATPILSGWVGNTFYSNPGDYKDSRGLLNSNGSSNSSEVVGGTAGADSMKTGGGNDTAWGDDGNDTIDGGKGFNYLHGGNGDDVIRQDEFGMMWGDAGNDSIYGGSGADQIFGDDGNDYIVGNKGADVLNGGNGDDVIYGDSAASAPGVPPINTSGDGDDVLNGGNGNDTLYGGGGADVISGNEGNDVIYGGEGRNVLNGNLGDDTFIMDSSDPGMNNIINGGVGHDIVDYRFSTGQSILNTITGKFATVGINIDLGNVRVGVIPPQGTMIPNTFTSIEEVFGSNPGSPTTPAPFRSNGNDTISGGVGIQVDAFGNPILGANGLPLPIDYTFHGLGGDDLLTGGTLLGGGNDTLFGDTGNDTLSGLDGNDSLDGGVGVDVLIGGAGNDIMDGGVDNNDTAVFQGTSANYTIEGRNLAAGVWAADLNLDGFISVNDAIGVDGNDLLKNTELLRFTNETIRIGGLAVRNDFDSDGKADIIFRNSTNNNVILWEGNGLTPINLATQQATIGTALAANTIVGTGDFNSDGRSDVLFQNANGDIVFWPGKGLAPATPPVTIGSVAGLNLTVMGTGDFNGDKKADVLLQDNLGNIVIWQGNGSAPATQAPIANIGINSGWTIKGTGDFDGDGKSDILWRHSSGAVAVWLGNGLAPLNAAAQTAVISPADNTWVIEGVDDFNGDGKSDILWRHTSGAVGVWQTNGLLPVTQSAVIGAVDATWDIAGTGDYNGDSKGDILWRQSTGAIGVWQLDGLNPVAQSQAAVIGFVAAAMTISAPKL
jgi:Ca2+-binding RTX toxin-like protein